MDNQKIEQMYEFYQSGDGKTLREVGEQFGGLSKQRVEQIFKEHELPTRSHTNSALTMQHYANTKKRLQEDRKFLPKDELTLALNEKLTYKQVCERFGCTITTLKNSLEKYNLTGQYVKIKNPELTTETLRKLYLDDNMTAQAIADQFGYSKPTITKRLSRNNIHKFNTTAE